jgi:hypothetical protein
MKTSKYSVAKVYRNTAGGKIRYRRFTLVEVLIYIAVLAVVTGLALSLFHRGFANSRNLRLAADDVLRISRLGDRWRERVRQAADFRLDQAEMSIVHSGGKTFFYKFADGAIKEKEGDAGQWRTLMANIKSCSFTEIKNPGFTTWELNVELRTRTPNAKVKPLFSFIAVNRKDKNS